MRFEGVAVYCINLWHFRRGGAMALPGIGIITGRSGIKNGDLLQHEFGHILQYRQCGFIFYWFRIAPSSLASALKAKRVPEHRHMQNWTEWTANLLSYHHGIIRIIRSGKRETGISHPRVIC